MPGSSGNRVGNLTSWARLEAVEAECAGDPKHGRAGLAHRSRAGGIRPQNSLDLISGPRGATSAPVAANAHRCRRMSPRALELPGEAKTSRCANPRARRGAESAEYGRDNVIKVRSPPQSRTRNRP